MEIFWDTESLDIHELADEVDPNLFEWPKCPADNKTCEQQAAFWEKPKSFDNLVKRNATFMQLKDDKHKFFFWKNHELRAWYDINVSAIFATNLLV